MTGSTSVSSTTSSGLGISGLSSGIDTSSLITKLMSIESAPQTALKTQLSTAQTHTTALQSLNALVASIASAATTASTAGALTSYTATSSDPSVSATADKTASAGSLSFTVTQLAQAQVSVTGAMSSWPDSSSTPSITITTGSGSTAVTKTFTAASTNLDDVVAAIDGSGAGVTATKIQAGTDSNGVAQYRLQLRSASTGAAGAFTISTGSQTSGDTTLPPTTVQSAQDAKLRLYAGTSAQQDVTSSSNTFTNLVTGVSVTAAVVTGSPVTITTAADPTAATTSAQSLVASLASLFSSIAAAAAVSTSTSNGSTSTSGGVFTGDTQVRGIDDQLLAAATGALGASTGTAGTSPSSIGITITKDGSVTFDQGAFSAAMAKDPVGTTATYQAIAARVATAATAISDPYTGSLTQQISSEQTSESSLTGEISDWDTRLAAIQAQYQSQFDAMETALNALSSQASYLTSQITGLTTNYESSH